MLSWITVKNEIELIKLLHFILKPTAILKHVDTSKIWKVTTLNSADAFMAEVSTLLELENLIRKRKDTYLNYNLTLQPQIFFVKKRETICSIYWW